MAGPPGLVPSARAGRLTRLSCFGSVGVRTPLGLSKTTSREQTRLPIQSMGQGDARRGCAACAWPGGITHDCVVRRARFVLGVGCVRARTARARRQLAPLGGQMRSSSLPTPFRPILEQPIARLIVAPRCEPVRRRLVAWLQRGQNRRLSTPVSFAWPERCTRLNGRVHTKPYIKMKAPKVLDRAQMRVVASPRCASALFAQVGLRAVSALPTRGAAALSRCWPVASTHKVPLGTIHPSETIIVSFNTINSTLFKRV